VADPVSPLSRLVYDYLLRWLESPWPLPLDACFGRRAPRVLEAGFGNGDFLVGLAQRRPETDFLGIETSWGSVQRLLRRIAAARLVNVRVLMGDAAFLLDRTIPPESLREIYVNFSDPWRKSRHHNRRLIQPAFLETVWRRLETGGVVTVATDHAEYADWIARAFEGQDRLVPVSGTTRVPSIPGRRTTRYEAKALAAGKPIHYFVWNKPRPCPEPESPAAKEEPSMPNVILEGTLREGRLWPDPAVPAIREHRGETEILIRFTGLYRDVDRGGWFVSTLVKEGPLTQHFGVLLAPRPNRRFVLNLAEVGRPRPTQGVKRAIYRLAELILAHQPELAPVGSSVGIPRKTRPSS